VADRVEVPVEEAVSGDWVVYISNARPAGQVTRKVVGKTRDKLSGHWMIRVAWGTDKTEAIPSSRIKHCLRDAVVQQALDAKKAKEQAFHANLLAGLGIKRG